VFDFFQRQQVHQKNYQGQFHQGMDNGAVDPLFRIESEKENLISKKKSKKKKRKESYPKQNEIDNLVYNVIHIMFFYLSQKILD